MKYKALYKYELADYAGVSPKTFRKWLSDCENDLKEFGYDKNDNILSPGAVRFLCEKYVIILE